MDKIKNNLFFLVYLLANPRLILKWPKVYLPVYIQYEWLSDFKINTLIDVGAYKGRVSDTCLSLFPDIKIYAFEPDSGCTEYLKNKWKGKDIVIVPKAVDEKEGKRIYYENTYGPASSLLSPSEHYKKTFKVKRKHEVATTTLDNYFSNKKIGNTVLLKVDVQGLEARILKGARKTLEKVSIVHIESSFDELYENQDLFHDIYSILTMNGFKYVGDIPDAQFYPKFRPLSVVNSIYIRPSILKIKY